jgi:hypothetical protein
MRGKIAVGIMAAFRSTGFRQQVDTLHGIDPGLVIVRVAPFRRPLGIFSPTAFVDTATSCRQSLNVVQVKSSTNTPVTQGTKQMHHIERRCEFELPRQSCRLGRACVGFYLTQVLLWFCLELPRKGSKKGGGICDARVDVHPVNWLTPEVQNPETQTHFAN